MTSCGATEKQFRYYSNPGQTSVAGFIAAHGEEATYCGGAVVQVIENLGAELYLSYYNADLDVNCAADPKDIDIVTAGALFNF